MSDARYAPYYCEENVWWLAQHPRFAGQRADAVIVSNPRRTVALWAQRSAHAPGAPVVWDYHVVLAVGDAPSVEVWDLDCARGAPLAAAAWLDASFPVPVAEAHAPRFRVVEAPRYVARFASDRRHMRSETGGWYAPPPPWPTIGGGVHELEPWIDVTDETLGPVIDLPTLRQRWLTPARPG